MEPTTLAIESKLTWFTITRNEDIDTQIYIYKMLIMHRHRKRRYITGWSPRIGTLQLHAEEVLRVPQICFQPCTTPLLHYHSPPYIININSTYSLATARRALARYISYQSYMYGAAQLGIGLEVADMDTGANRHFY